MPLIQTIVERVVRRREKKNHKGCFDNSHLPKLWELYAEIVNAAEEQEEDKSNAGRLGGTQRTGTKRNQTPE